MIEYPAVVFWTDESNFEGIKAVLRDEFGLVAPTIADEERLRRQLVWEDDSNVGRYRVNFAPEHKQMRMDDPKTGKVRYITIDNFTSGAKVAFRYWSQRLDEETEKKDPMKTAYLKIYESLKPVKVTDFVCEDIDLEVLLDS
ncbi:hypothetical protein GOV06_03100 [Candidatus Woesearchaeota archaeon]|nr:hypothetical protein [Candidatus Woesearchaeota archaeon]